MPYCKHNNTRKTASGNSDAADLCLRRNVVKVRQLGDRALCEMLEELGAITGHRATVDDLVARYAAIDQTSLYVARGDRFAPNPDLRIVRSGP
jgi:hypothetical protein